MASECNPQLVHEMYKDRVDWLKVAKLQPVDIQLFLSVVNQFIPVPADADSTVKNMETYYRDFCLWEESL